MKRHHGHSNFYKRKYLIVVAPLQFRGLIYNHGGAGEGSVQADMVLETELRLLHLDLQAAGCELSHGVIF